MTHYISDQAREAIKRIMGVKSIDDQPIMYMMAAITKAFSFPEKYSEDDIATLKRAARGEED
jgi:hypothetical protein